MISEMAMEDVADIRRRCGCDLDPRDIVRLNAVGCAVEHHAHSGERYALPRLAYLGDVVFREPTIGAELWLRELEAVYDMTNAETALVLRATAMMAGDLPPATDLRAVRKAVKATSRRLAPFTVRQVAAAVAFAMNGDDPTAGEEAAKPQHDEKRAWWFSRKRDARRHAVEVGLLRVGQAFKLGTYEELKKMTVSGLQAAIVYASELGVGRDGRKSEHARLLSDYFRTRDEIAAKYSRATGV